jgi:hypothetical protein
MSTTAKARPKTTSREEPEIAAGAVAQAEERTVVAEE